MNQAHGLGAPERPRNQAECQFPWGLALAASVAALLRFDLFNDGLYMLPDEAFSWRIATEHDLRLWCQMVVNDVHPPFYYVCLTAWVRLFGASPFALRSLSAALGVLTVGAVAWYTRLWAQDSAGAKPAAGLAAWLVALSIPQVALAHIARMYTLMTLLAVLATGGLLLARQRPEPWRSWLLYSIAATLLIYTHNYGLYLVAGQAAWVAWSCLVGSRLSRPERRRLATQAAVAFFLVGALYLPWVPSLRHQMRLVAADYWIPPLTWSGVPAFLVQLTSIPLNEFPDLNQWTACGLIVLALAVLWPYRNTLGETQIAFVFGAHVVLIAATRLFLGRWVFVPRYLVHLLPFYLVPVAYWVCRIRDSMTRRVVSAWLLVTVIYGLYYVLWPYTVSCRPDRDFRRVVADLQHQAKQGDLVIVTDRRFYLILDYYLTQSGSALTRYLVDPDVYQITKAHEVHGSVIKPHDLWEPQMALSLQDRPVWLLSTFSEDWSPPGRNWVHGKSYSLPSGTLGMQDRLDLSYYQGSPPK
jgi:mannosyltransferase